jgi:hypothetical protein
MGVNLCMQTRTEASAELVDLGAAQLPRTSAHADVCALGGRVTLKWDLGSGPNFVKRPALPMAFYIRDDLTTV